MIYLQMYQYLDEVPSSKSEIGQISEMTLQILDVLLSSANNSLNKQAVRINLFLLQSRTTAIDAVLYDDKQKFDQRAVLCGKWKMARQRIELSSSSIVVVVVVVLGYIYIWGRVIYGLANDKWGFDFLAHTFSLSVAHSMSTCCRSFSSWPQPNRSNCWQSPDQFWPHPERIPWLHLSCTWRKSNSSPFKCRFPGRFTRIILCSGRLVNGGSWTVQIFRLIF